jgi:flagellar L-ring protein precursor FlgH
MNKVFFTCALALAGAWPLAAAAAGNAQSLYDQDTYRPLVAEAKAYRVGDVLTVVVQEAASASAAADSSAQRRSALAAQLSTQRLGPYSANVSAATDSDGGGRTQRSGRLLATLSVQVTGLTANGDLMVEGQQLLLLNGEKQLISLSGVVRPRDVGENNVVSSSRIADARIEFDGEGFIADKSRPGWLSRFFSLIGL